MADMPTGAVTFLFTDIEGSTRLVKHLRERYAGVLADQQRLLRAAFDAHDGYEVDTQGDSFFVAFARARDGLLAAVDGQRALLSHQWPVGVQIRVRMGIHTGQAVASDGRYTGLAVHRAARIGSAGHGGQILVSQATQTLLEDEEEDLRVALRDLGEQRLKDLDRPVRLYQAAADGLPDSFPPVRGDVPQDDAERAPPSLLRRGWVAALVGVLALVAALILAALLLRGDSAGGLGAIQANHVGLIDPASDEIVAELQVGIRPGPVAAGEGSIWVGNLDDRTLTRIDPVERTPTATIPLDNRTPTGIAVGLDAVWVAHGLRGDVSRVDPQFGQVTGSTPVGGSAFGSASGSVAVDTRAVWAAFGDSTLGRLDAEGQLVGETVVGSQPAGVATAPGSVWVANSGDATVQRYHPETFEQGPIRTFNVAAEPIGVIYASGAIWVANAGGDVVTRIEPSSGAIVQIPVGDGPSAIASGAGTIWVANVGSRTVSRIDPRTNQVVATIEVGNAPSGVVFSEGFVWVAAQLP